MRARIWDCVQFWPKSLHESLSAYLANVVEGEGNSAIGSRAGTVLATQEELKAGCTRAVGDSDGASELDEVGGGDGALGVGDEALLERDDLVSATIGRELRFDVAEQYEGAVSTVTVKGR